MDDFLQDAGDHDGHRCETLERAEDFAEMSGLIADAALAARERRERGAPAFALVAACVSLLALFVLCYALWMA